MLIINKGNLTLLVSEDVHYDLNYHEAKEIRDSYAWQGINGWRFPTPDEMLLIQPHIDLFTTSCWGISDITNKTIQKPDKNGIIKVKELSVYQEVPYKILIDDLERAITTTNSKHGVILVKVVSDKKMNNRNIVLRPKKRNVEKDNMLNVVFNDKNKITIKSIANR